MALDGNHSAGTGDHIGDHVLLEQSLALKETTAHASATYALLTAVALNAKTAFGAVGDGTTDDTTALQNAIAGAIAQHRPLFIPAGTYKITAALDARARGLHVFGASSEVISGVGTIIRQHTANTPILKVGKFFQHFHDFHLTYNVAPVSSDTAANAIEFYKSAWSTFERIAIRKVGRALARLAVNYDDGLTTTGNNVFSCTFNDFHISGFAIQAIFFEGGGSAGSTGCVFTNIYINNNPDGPRLACSAPVIFMAVYDEMVFNQLNIEWCLLGSRAILCDSGGNMVINGLHFEQVQLTTGNGAYIQASYGPQIQINGFSFVYNDIQSSASHALVDHFQHGSVKIRGFYQHDNTLAGSFAIDNASGATAGTTTVEFDGDASLFTAPVVNEQAAPNQVLTRVNQVNYRQYLGPIGTGYTYGEAAFSRESGKDEATLTSGTMYANYFTARSTRVITKMRAASGGTAAVGTTLARMGLCTVDAAGLLTLVASTVNDTTLFNSTYVEYTKALSASYTITAGQRYALVVLFVGTTPPKLFSTTVPYFDNAKAPRNTGSYPGRTDLPATATEANMTNAVSFAAFLTAWEAAG